MPSFEALRRLKAGNQRFANGKPNCPPPTREELIRLADEGQSPWAVILGCSDSRVPVENIFDQSPGALFVVRVAGHVATETTIESIEFAVDAFNAPLVVVLGHSLCGAVGAALAGEQNPRAPSSHLLDTIRQDIQKAHFEAYATHPQLAYTKAIHAHVTATTKRLLESSPVIAQRVKDGRLTIAGAKYELSTGQVHFHRKLLYNGIEGAW